MSVICCNAKINPSVSLRISKAMHAHNMKILTTVQKIISMFVLFYSINISAVKLLITSKIKVFVYIIYVFILCIFIMYCIYKYKNIQYIFKKNMLFLYIKYIYI